MLLGRSALRDYSEGVTREWIVANGLGGYSSSTVILANTRKYHGLLVAPLKPPWERKLFLAKLEEEVFLDGARVQLSVNRYPGVVHPKGHEFLEEFRLDAFPTFLYSFGWRLEKSIHMVHGHNAVVVRYKILEGGPGIMRLYPLVNSRGIHELTRMRHQKFDVTAWEKGFNVAFGEAQLIVASDAMRYQPSGFPEEARWHRNMEYEEEMKRGYDYHEDHYSPGFFELKVQEGSAFNLLATGGYGAERSFRELYSTDPSRFDELKKKEEKRLEDLKGILPVELRHLTGAGDSFLVKTGSATGVIAGYHWFSTWGRDAFVSLPGLCLVTGRFEEARGILRWYASYLRDGVLPNFVGSSGASYNSVDSSLWFIYALHKYLAYADDLRFCKEMWPAVEEIIAHYRDGVRLGESCTARVDSDGLLKTLGRDSNVTWMDAKAGGRPVTPREGKPVEVNALWHNALMAASVMLKRLGKDSSLYTGMADAARAGFKSFWNRERSCLYDVLGEDGGDASVRPNQLFAVSLPFGLMGNKAEKMIIKKVEDELLTPYGIRSLSPKDAGYIGVYEGDQARRDSAYHMGTVWSWLMGPYISGFLKCEGRSQSALSKSRKLLRPLMESHLMEAGLGTISEIFDGDSPHRSRGCISQAWGVAELLRCYVENIEGKRPANERKWLNNK